MKTSIMSYAFKLSLAIATLLSIATIASADDGRDAARLKRYRERQLNTISKTRTPAEGFESVDMFEAMKKGEIQVLIRTKSSAESNLIVTNKTDRPLAITMPKAFSAVPAMRQFGGGLGGGGLGGGGLGAGGLGGGGLGGYGGGFNQGLGGGFGGGIGGGGFGAGGLGGGGGGLGGGAGVFNIPAGKAGKLHVNTVCLEHGKPDPRPQIDYVVQPLEKFNTDPKIYELCRMMAEDEVAQPVVQAAAWHVANGLSWEQLLVMNRIERMDGSFERYFHPLHVRYAQQATAVAAQRAELRKRLEAEKKQQPEPRTPVYSSENSSESAGQ